MRAKWIAIVSVIVVIGGAAVLLASSWTKLKARDNLNRAVRSYEAGQYSQSAKLFQEACDLDPTWSTPRLYLGMSYMSQWVPGSESPENKKYAQLALDQFQKVLNDEPKGSQSYITATAFIASIYFNEKDFDKAEDWNKKLIALDPNNKSAYYTLGVIAWTKWVQEDLKARADMKMKREDPGPLKDKKIREELKAKWMPILDEGIQNVDKALKVDPNYDDAMAYMNLLIRYRGDLLDTPEEYKQQEEIANNWVNKSMEAKKANAEKKEKAAQNGTKAP
jgi:tetratricopeptide (TPR) repeat protein